MSNHGNDTQTIVAGLAVTLADGVLPVTIDRPKSLNSLTKPVLVGIADAMEDAATLPDLESAFVREFHGQAVLLRSNDFIEGATAFQQHRAANFTGS